MHDRLRWWMVVGVLPLLLPSLGAAFHTIGPSRTMPSHTALHIARPSETARPPFGGARHVQRRRCIACSGRTPRRAASRRALPPLKNNGHLPVSVVLRPHALGALFGVGSYVSERGPELAGMLVPRIQLLRAGWVREELTASVLHSGPGKPYQWGPFDRVVNRERAAGLHVLGLLDYSDTWRYHSHTAMAHADMDRLSSDFARYAAAVVRHFRGRISNWEVWNEPNIATFWNPRPNPGDYARLLTRAYRAIKAVEPRSTVITGGMSGVDLHYLRAVVARTNAFDAIAVHPYRVVPEDQLLRQIAALRRFHRPLWFTEVGWPASDRCPLCTDEATQAGDLVRFYTLAASAGISHIFWYDLRDDLQAPRSPEGHFGLLRRDLAGKPAFAAYRFLARALAGGRFLGADALDRAGVYALRFQSAGGTVVVLWNTKSIARTVSVPWAEPGTALLSLDGAPLRVPGASNGAIRIHLSASSDPVYLVSSPLTQESLPGPLLWPAHRRTPHRLRTARRTHAVRHVRNRPRAESGGRGTKRGRRRPIPTSSKHGRQMGPRAIPTPTRETARTDYRLPSPRPTPTPDALTTTPPVPTVTDSAATPQPDSTSAQPTPSAAATPSSGAPPEATSPSQ